MRPFCKVCGKNPRAVAYYRNGVRYYRSRCRVCIRLSRGLAAPVPRWQGAGYKKKMICDLCGFKARYSSQITVFHCDGNQNNNQLINLRSVCLNCVETVKRKNEHWVQGDLQPD